MLDEHAKMLSKEIEIATKITLIDLYENQEHFYYCSLTTSGDGGSPIFSAWSKEALEKVDMADRENFKWSYADSPYCLYSEENWNTVRSMFLERPNIHALDEAQYFNEFNSRIEAMVLAMKNLDKEGIFELNQKRENIVINVEVIPPDETNTERAYFLNPIEALKDWLNESAE